MKNRLLLILLFLTKLCPAQKLKITTFLANDGSIDSLYRADNQIIGLNYRQTSITIFYKDFTDAKANYDHKLVGFDRNWQPVNQNNYAHYTNLLGGVYEFRVRNHRFPDKISVVKFKIEDAFWQSTWFIPAMAGYVLLLLGLIFYLFQLGRFQQLKRLQNVRNDISADLHDDIGSTLANISFLTEIAKNRLTQRPEDVPMILDKILIDSREMVQTMRGMIWTINPKNDNAVDFFDKIKNLSQEMLKGHSTNLVYDVELPTQQKMTIEQQRNVFLVLKEAVHNCIKHAQASEIKMVARVEKNWLMIQLKDNGKGFDSTLIGTDSNGLQNIKHRIEQLKGTFEITGNDGTRLRISIPLS